MGAIARLWFKWIQDITKPHSFDDVPPLWRNQVKELMDEQKASEGNNESAGEVMGDNRGTEQVD